MRASAGRLLLLGAAVLALPTLLLAHGVSAGDQATLSAGGLGAYVYVGAKHMLTGYDHLLFLAGVIFYLRGWRDVVRFITVFTVAHSITLTGATYLGITADEHLVDAVIGASVLYKGFENLGGFQKVLGTRSPNLLAMVFAFGLIHGFGLATRLQSFELDGGGFLAKILCFNVGVELGQVLALLPIVGLIGWWRGRPSYEAFYRAVNWYLVLAGVGLVVYQLWGYAQGTG